MLYNIIIIDSLYVNLIFLANLFKIIIFYIIYYFLL